MYNRYIPQPDGSFRRNRMPNPPQPPPPPPGPPQEPPRPQEAPCPAAAPPVHSDAGGFLRQLIPKGLDTGDLLVIVLLLLMAGDCQEEKNSALLTLALYLFL